MELIYNQLLDMHLIVLLCMLGLLRAELPIRTGISRLQGPIDKASYSLPFKTSLLRPTYKSLVAVSYISSFSTRQGLDITSSCSPNSPAYLKCSISSKITSQFSEVYLSYIVSDLGSLHVGTYTKTFSLAYTGTVEQVLFKADFDPKFINNTNSLFVQFYPFIAGVSCLDGDFSLDIAKPKFDSLTLEVSMDITIKEVHVKSVTVVFGYMIFDGKQVSVGKYEDQNLHPGAVPKGYIYGIKNIKSSSMGAPRLLQALSLAPPAMTATDPATISPTIQAYPKNATKVDLEMRDKFTPTPQSLAASLLRGGPAGIRQLDFKNIELNPSVFALVAQGDGVIDADSATLQALQSLGLFSTSTYASNLTRLVAHRAVRHSHKSADGVDSNLFNNFFGTDGFVIMASEVEIDQIYYFEVNPISKLYSPNTQPPPSTAPPSIMAPFQNNRLFYKSAVTNKKPNITCRPGGKLVGMETQIDYIQKQMVLRCVYCSPGTYISPITKSCKPNPTRSASIPPSTFTPGQGVVRIKNPEPLLESAAVSNSSSISG